MTYVGLFAFPYIEQLSMMSVLTIFVASSVAMTIPTQGGVGSYHTIIPFTLGLYLVPKDSANSFAVIFHLWHTLTTITVGSICLLLGRTLYKKTHEITA